MFVEAWTPETARLTHFAAISFGRLLDPNLDPTGRTVTLCGLTARSWERGTHTKLADLADADNGNHVNSTARRMAKRFANSGLCEECRAGMLALHASFPDGSQEQAYVAARAMTTMSLVRRADKASSEAREARDTVVRRAVEAGITRYRVAQLLGLSETAVGKIVG